MNIANTYINKLDNALRQVLTQARGNEFLRVVMLLGAEENDSRGVNVENEPDPKQFSSRQDYRQAMIDYRKNQLQRRIGPTLRHLAEIALNPRGGQVSEAVVVEGTADKILSALELPGVRHASLDQEVRLINPNR